MAGRRGGKRSRGSHCLFFKELLVEEEDEQVDIHFGLIEHLHHGHALVLELQEVLVLEQELLHLHAQEASLDPEAPSLRPRTNVEHNVLEPAVGPAC